MKFCRFSISGRMSWNFVPFNSFILAFNIAVFKSWKIFLRPLPQSAEMTTGFLPIHAININTCPESAISPTLGNFSPPKARADKSTTRRNLARWCATYWLPDRDYFTYFDWTHPNFATIRFSTLWWLFCTYARWDRMYAPPQKHRSIDINIPFTIKIRLILKLSPR